MIKKLLLCLALAVATVSAAYADEYTHDSTILPQAARDVIHTAFKAEISVIKIDKDFGRVSEYEVVLTDGSEIQFDSKGNWKDVEAARGKSVPGIFVAGDLRKKKLRQVVTAVADGANAIASVLDYLRSMI